LNNAVRLNSGCLLVFSLESFNAPCGVDQFLFAGKERMALRADFQMNLRFRRPRPEGFAASASDDSVHVVGMNI
jgi:hypothetical protein